MNKRFELLNNVCDNALITVTAGGGNKTKSPSETFKTMNSLLIDLQDFLRQQRAFEAEKCSHILCGDTKNSCVIIGLALRLFKPTVVYEIGRYHGWSTTQMAFSLKNNFDEIGVKAKFISIDPHVGAAGGPGWDQGLNKIGKQCGGLTEWDTSRNNINKSGIGEFVTPVKAFSGEYIKDVTDKIEFIFIDGDHTYKGATSDIALYGDKLVKDGICIIHDVWGDNIPDDTNFGPSRAYAEAPEDMWEKIGITWNVGILRKK